ncbi:MAG: tRNA lysidine(34) synthetase TilS C-terminal domain-containing protein, partial [Coraliomargarita sp.]
ITAAVIPQTRACGNLWVNTEWFSDRHIPQLERKQLPVVSTESGHILWVPGFAPAESHKIGPDTKLALRLTYQRGVSL